MQETERYKKLRDDFSKDLEKAQIETEKTAWDFYTNSTDENMKIFQAAEDSYYKLFQNKTLYSEFKKIDSEQLTEHEKKQLEDLLKDFDEELNTGELKKELRQKENEIGKKYNSYVPKINGKESSKTEISKILQTETDTNLREKAYEAKILGGDLICEDLINLINLRNTYAKQKGYKNFFEYELYEKYDVKADFLENLINDVYFQSSEKIKLIQEKNYQELKDFFGIEKLEAHHYGLLLDSNPEKEVNEIFAKLAEKDKFLTETLSKKIYRQMGYDVEDMINKKKLTLDLYPRKNKNTHGFCFCIEAGKDSRILANLTHNVQSLDTLNHELGHCVYDLGLDINLPFLDRKPSSSAFTEAIAMMMGDIMKCENILDDILPEKLLANFKDTHKKDEALFISRSLLIIEFEREIYKNPEQNPKILWKELKHKYLNRDEKADNEWATIPHYLSHPAYYQNYFRATLMKAQIYNHLKNVLGHITENKNTAKYLNENIFKFGSSIEEYELIEKLTGKNFSHEDFIKTL